MARYRNILVLTGSGISAESGLATFRDQGGLWERHRIEDVATPEAFARNPEFVQNFYNARRAQLAEAAPNPAHEALARLERGVRSAGGAFTLVTQNVDDLHERAGSETVLHMHGELAKARCLGCGTVQSWTGDIGPDDRCSACAAAGLRPHVVWFGEIPLYLDEIDAALSEADLFVSIGTSGAVYPAAGLVTQAPALGRAHTVEINLEPSEGRQYFAEARHGPASRIVPAYVEELLAWE